MSPLLGPFLLLPPAHPESWLAGRSMGRCGASWITLLFITLACLVVSTRASIGDRSLAYNSCVNSCITSLEPVHDYGQGVDSGWACDLPLSLRWSRWSCLDDCSYHCMHNLTDAVLDRARSLEDKARALPGLPLNRVVQYHGKWPFYRLMGIQEPFSVLFSLGNLYMHAKYGLFALRRRLPREIPRPLRRAYAVVPFAGVNLWIWSIVFHTRDKPWTEKADYFSAALSTMCSLYLAIVRVAKLHPPIGGGPGTDTGRLLRPAIAAFLSAIYVAHVSYLTFWHFDYGYNMLFNVGLGLLHNAFWAVFALQQYLLPALPSSASSSLSKGLVPAGPHRAAHYLQPIGVMLLLSSLMALELLDFPPFFRALDAHALWHASTVLVVKLWYQALLRDAYWLAGREDGHGEGRYKEKDKERMRLA